MNKQHDIAAVSCESNNYMSKMHVFIMLLINNNHTSRSSALSHLWPREVPTRLHTANTHCSPAARLSFSALSCLVASLRDARCEKTRDSVFLSPLPSLSFFPASPVLNVPDVPFAPSAGMRQHQPEKRVVFFGGALFTQQAGRHGHCRQTRGRTVLSDSVSFVLAMVAVAVTVAVAVAVMLSCSSHSIPFAKRGLIGGRTQHEGRQPLVRSSPRGVFSHPTCARTRSTPASLALSLVTPQRSFSHLFLRPLLPSSAHLSTFNPLARSRSSARPSRS